MRKHLLVLALCLLVVFLSAGTPVGEPTPIRVGAYENPPKIFTDENGTPAGFWPEILNDIARQENWKIIWVSCDWQDCLSQLESNQIDLMPDMGWSSVRADKYLFTTEPVLISWARVYVLPDSKIETILDLDGKKVAGLTGSLNFDGPEGIKEISRSFGVESTYLEKASYEEVLQAVAQGEADAGITNKDYGDINERRFGLERTPVILQPTQIMFALSNNNPTSQQYADILDAHIRKYKENSSSIYYQNLDKFLGVQSAGTVQVIPNWLRTSLLVGAAGIFFLVALIFVTRQQVCSRTRQLSTSEARYRALLSNLPDLILRMNHLGEFLDYHVASDNSFPFAPETILHQNVRDVLPADLAEAFLQNIKKALDSNEIVIHDFRMQFDEKWYEFEGRYKASGDREVVVIIRDMTFQRHAQTEIRKSE